MFKIKDGKLSYRLKIPLKPSSGGSGGWWAEQGTGFTP